MKVKYIAFFLLTGGLLSVGISCSDSFLEQNPPGAYSESSLQNAKGIEGMLIAAYSALDGSYFESWGNQYFNQHGGSSNWVLGSIRGGEAYKGTEPSDGVDINPLERHEAQPSNPHILNKWRASYDGISKANVVLKNLPLVQDISAETAARIEGEAKFLRAHYHFELQKVFGVPAYVDETVTDFAAVENDHVIWPEIEKDFQDAFNLLPSTQIAAGRANKWAAGAYLGKVYLYQAKWQQARDMFTQVIQNGTTAAGASYALMPRYADNFRAAAEAGNTESIFAYESSFGDGSISNGNYENTLNMPHGSSAKTSCCGFYQPSQNLVNSFKTDASGLPLFDTYNASDLKNDEGLESDAAYTPDTTTPVDPRLDWTAGRRGIPYLDWGPHPGKNWIRLTSFGGPYSPIKNVPYLSDFDNQLAGSVDWGFVSSALNVHIIRYADVLLMAAEAEAELGNTDAALNYVNQVRARAANPDGFVEGSPANYVIGEYTSFASPAEALEAIRFERKLELGMEGHRFFDLVRWDNAGSASKLPFDMEAYLNNEYLSEEATKRSHVANAAFTEKYKYLPIPEFVITQGTVAGVRMIDQSTAWGGSRDLGI
jgi:tetratricopeptide (TPR) repeat protein